MREARKSAERTAGTAGAAYVEDLDGGLARDTTRFSDLGPQQRRAARAAKAWATIAAHGTERLGRTIERNVRQAELLERLVRASGRLELMAPVGLNVVCFRYVGEGGPGDPRALGALNRRILVELQEEGLAVPSHTRIDGHTNTRRAEGPMGIELRVGEATEILDRTPDVLAELLEGLPERWLHADEGADSFSPYEVVGHLIHGERTDWLPRLRIVAEVGEARPFEPFDRFAHREEGWERPMGELLVEFARLRDENLAALDDLLDEGLALSDVGTHPELGRLTAGELIAAWAVHDLGHLRQVARTLAAQYRDQVGPLKAYLPVLGE